MGLKKQYQFLILSVLLISGTAQARRAQLYPDSIEGRRAEYSEDTGDIGAALFMLAVLAGGNKIGLFDEHDQRNTYFGALDQETALSEYQHQSSLDAKIDTFEKRLQDRSSSFEEIGFTGLSFDKQRKKFPFSIR